MRIYLEKLDQPLTELREGAFAPSTWNEGDRTVELTWTTGARVLRRPWLGKPYEEELSLEEGHVRLGRLKKGAPLLVSHDGGQTRSVIGVVLDADIRGGVGWALVRLSAAESAADDVFKVLEGTLRNVSVGYSVLAYEKTEREGAVDLYRAIDWEPHELSIVPIPADADAQVRSLNSPEPASLAEPKERQTMPTDKTETTVETTVETETAPNVVDIRKAAISVERKRCKGIRAAAAKLGVNGDVVDRLIDDGVALDAARAALIDAHATAVEREIPSQDGHHVGIERDERETRAAAISEALLWRSRPGDFELTERAREHRYSSLVDIAADCLRSAGVSTKGLSKYEIATRAIQHRSGAFVAGDFSDLTVSTSRRILRRAYNEAPATYQSLAQRRTSPDFKNTKELIFGGMGVPTQILEGGEFKSASESVQGKEWSLSTYGHKMALTLQAIVNDDLSAFQRLSSDFGRAARRLENKTFFDTLLANPNVYDGAAMFSAGRGNTLAGGSGGDPSKAQYAAARAILGKQAGLDSDEDLELEIRYILTGMDQITNAESMTLPIAAATVGNAVSPTFQRYQPIASARIDRTDGDVWFAVADPADQPSAIYAHLQGMENGPAVEQQNQWNSLAIEWRSYTFFAVSFVDFRGWVINDQNNTIIP
jgi:hypothetical protein